MGLRLTLLMLLLMRMTMMTKTVVVSKWAYIHKILQDVH